MIRVRLCWWLKSNFWYLALPQVSRRPTLVAGDPGIQH
jgi:hypothetical protein